MATTTEGGTGTDHEQSNGADSSDGRYAARAQSPALILEQADPDTEWVRVAKWVIRVREEGLFE